MKLAMILTTAEAEADFNALRLANYALEQGDVVQIFLLGKGVELHQIQDAKFDVREQAETFLSAGGRILACGTCLELRHSNGSEICPLSTMKDLYEMVKDADKVLTFCRKRRRKMHILVIGGSFGGLTTAYALRKRLGHKKCRITLVSRESRFVFIPSLPWVAMGSKRLDQISFDLAGPLERRGIRFVHAAAERIDPKEQKVFTGGDESYAYDYLVVATGHRSANEAVPGLGPWDGPGHSLMSPPEAEEAREALQAFLQNPGPIAVGCAPGASCIGPAYEFAFEIDYLLRKRRMRHKVPIGFVTPEPFLGHFGVGGMGKVRHFLEDEFEARDIRYFTSSAVSEITDTSVSLADGKDFESRFSLIIPPLAGVKAVSDSPGLANPKGFIPVDHGYRHKIFPNIYAVGVAVAFPPVDQTTVPVNFPKTGHMTEQMALVAAHNIAADIQGGERLARDLWVDCIMDMGATAAHMKADPVRPPRNLATVSQGKRWLWAKRLFERYYLWSVRRGRTLTRGLGW